MDDLICAAIRARRLLRFHYAGGSAPGFRTVEPHPGYRAGGGKNFTRVVCEVG